MKIRVVEDAILVSMDVASLYTNIPQEEGITIICKAYETILIYKVKSSLAPEHVCNVFSAR